MTNTTNHKQFSLESIDLGNRLESLNPKIKLEAEREAMLSRRANHNHTNFFVFSKFTQKLESVFVLRGQFFTNYKNLSKIWSCSKDQARYQLEKWKNNGKIKIKIVKDQRGFDLGVLITYNWLHNQQEENRKKRAKIPTRETTSKALQIKTKKEAIFKIPTHNPEVLPKGNIQKKNDVFLEKSKEEGKEITQIKKQFTEINLNHKVGKQLLETYEASLILDYLNLLELTGNKIKNKAGWLVQALKQNYDLQKVENWKSEEIKSREQEEEKQKIQEKREFEAMKLQQEQEKRASEEKKLILEWKNKNGNEAENNLYQSLILEWKNKKVSCFYDSLLKAKKQNESLIETAKRNPFAKAEVKTAILKQVKNLSEKLECLEIKTNKIVKITSPNTFKKVLSENEKLENVFNQIRQNAIKSRSIKIEKPAQSIKNYLSKFKI